MYVFGSGREVLGVRGLGLLDNCCFLKRTNLLSNLYLSVADIANPDLFA